MTSTVYVAKTVYGGDGLGRLGDGRVVFVPGALAGEQVKAEIVEEKRHWVRARLVEVVERSPDRVDCTDPVMPGMVYTHATYAAERRAKQQQLADFFERARIAAPGLAELAPAEDPLHYRNKAVYHFAMQKGKWVIGYRTEPSHEIVDVTDDPLVRPEINAKLGEVRQGVLALLTQGAPAVRRDVERKGNVTVRWSERTGVKWWLGDAPRDLVLKEVTRGRVFEVPAGGFYQVNPRAGDALVGAVADAYAKSPGPIVDLYCGVGVFGLCCAAGRNVPLVGVESGREAVEFAKRNAASLKTPGAFFAEQVGHSLKRIRIADGATVIVDPPRGGLEPRVPEWLATCGAERIFYVSCDPATLVRDLRTVCRGYEVEDVKWIDMFPRTARFETFVALRRRRNREGK